MLVFQWYFGKNVKLKALERALLEYGYVESVQIVEQTEKIVIYLAFGDIDNLNEAYGNVWNTVKDHLKRQPFEVKIENKTNSIIDDIYNEKIQFIIYEALATGEFTKMRERLNEIENTSDSLRIQVLLDSSNLYLHINLNESSYYKIIQR